MKNLFFLLLFWFAFPAMAQKTEADYLANPTAANLDLRYSFRDMRFETDTAHISGLHLVQRGDISYYTRPSDKLSINGARVTILYGFIQGRFATVTITAPTSDDAAKLLAALVGLYGQEDLVPKQYRDYFPGRHQWITTRATLRYEQANGGGATVWLASNALVAMYEKQQKTRARLAAGEL